MSICLSMLGCLTVKDPNAFPEIFRYLMSHGFYDRCILAVAGAQEAHNYIYRSQPLIVLTEKQTFTKPTIPPSIWEVTTTWVNAPEDDKLKSGRKRLREIAIRVAYITSAINHDREITPKAMQAALRLMEWQEQIRALYRPAEGKDKSTECTAAILDFYKTAPGYAHNFAKIATKKSWYHRFGADVVARIRTSLERDGILLYDKTQHMHYLVLKEEDAPQFADTTKGAANGQ